MAACERMCFVAFKHSATRVAMCVLLEIESLQPICFNYFHVVQSCNYYVYPRCANIGILRQSIPLSPIESYHLDLIPAATPSPQIWEE